MSITNPSFEAAGVGQGSAEGWALTANSGAVAVAAITAGDGLAYAWEDFSGWVLGQANYRASGFEDGDTTAGVLEDFALWGAGQADYRSAFLDSDTSPGPLGTEDFALWGAGQADYRMSGFELGDTTASTLEDFSAWCAGQADYRAEFDPGDTTPGTFQQGPGTTSGTETFAACRTDVAVQATSGSSTIAAAGHDFSVNDPVLLKREVVALFTPFQKGLTYYVKTIAAGVSVTLSATPGGAALTATADGEATMVGDPAYFWPNPISAW